MSGDADRMQQVVWNLLTNAIKFTNRGGKVDVSLTRQSGYVQIKVADNGIGIDLPFLSYVFDRFRQADSSSTRHHSGLGIGLAIVRHVVELHGGTVHAESFGHGHGATFTVSLPVSAVKMDSEQSSPQRRSSKSSTSPAPSHDILAGISILLVDDEPDAREMLTEVLQRHQPNGENPSGLERLGPARIDDQDDLVGEQVAQPRADARRELKYLEYRKV